MYSLVKSSLVQQVPGSRVQGPGPFSRSQVGRVGSLHLVPNEQTNIILSTSKVSVILRLYPGDSHYFLCAALPALSMK